MRGAAVLAARVRRPAGRRDRRASSPSALVARRPRGRDRRRVPAHDVTGPVVVGRVLDFEEETAVQRQDDPLVPGRRRRAASRAASSAARSTSPSATSSSSRCPASVLPGGFAITARKTYGHVSDGMICSGRELGIGDDHTGILVLPGETVGDAPLGADAVDAARPARRGARHRGHARPRLRPVDPRLAREAATALDVAFRDPADLDALPVDGAGHPVRRRRPDGCDRLVAAHRDRARPGRADADLAGAPAASCAGCARSRSPSTSPTT